MSAKRRRRVSKLIASIKSLVKEDKRKARIMGDMINYEFNKIRPEIEREIQGRLRDLLLGRKE